VIVALIVCPSTFYRTDVLFRPLHPSKIDDQAIEPGDSKGEGKENSNAFHIQFVIHLEIILT